MPWRRTTNPCPDHFEAVAPVHAVHVLRQLIDEFSIGIGDRLLEVSKDLLVPVLYCGGEVLECRRQLRRNGMQPLGAGRFRLGSGLVIRETSSA